MKTVNGIKLLQMIKEGKIKEKTEIKVWFDDGLKEYITTIYYDGIDLNWKPETFYARYLYNKHTVFEIMDKDTFEDIEELNLETEDTWGISTINGDVLEIGSFINAFNRKINKLIRNQKKIISKLEDNR